MTQLTSTLQKLVSEETGQSFYGLFIYDGEHGQPPTNSEPAFKLMQLQDYWIAFSDDNELTDCGKCAKNAPFLECTEDIRFCHLRFPLSEQGTAHAVQTLTDAARSPSTAFVVQYTLDDVQDSEHTGMNAQSIMRFPLKSVTVSDVKTASAALEADANAAEDNKSTIRTWTIVGIIVMTIIAAIVGITLFATKKQNQPKESNKELKKEKTETSAAASKSEEEN